MCGCDCGCACVRLHACTCTCESVCVHVCVSVCVYMCVNACVRTRVRWYVTDLLECDRLGGVAGHGLAVGHTVGSARRPHHHNGPERVQAGPDCLTPEDKEEHLSRQKGGKHNGKWLSPQKMQKWVS